MLPILLVLVVLQNLVAAHTDTSVPNGVGKGNWGAMEVCDEGTQATGFQLKLEGWQGLGDDTTVNGIRLFCTDLMSTDVKKTIASTEGQDGSWGPIYYCDSGYLTRFCLKVEDDGHADDTAVNNFKFKCSSGSEVEGKGGEWGEYGPWSPECKAGICGVKTRVLSGQGFWTDDYGLTDVQFRCLES